MRCLISTHIWVLCAGNWMCQASVRVHPTFRELRVRLLKTTIGNGLLQPFPQFVLKSSITFQLLVISLIQLTACPEGLNFVPASFESLITPAPRFPSLQFQFRNPVIAPQFYEPRLGPPAWSQRDSSFSHRHSKNTKR